MPELPEVETIVRELRPRLLGRRIQSLEILHPRIIRHSDPDISAHASGQRVIAVRRHGKFMVFDLERGCLTIHLGMTGQLVFGAAPGPHTRAIFTLDDSTLLYNDSRMFGSIEWGAEPTRTLALGPDAFESALDPALLRRKAPIKAILLNQRVFAGVGNIYADEALFRARIHPKRIGTRIGPERASRLIAVIRDLLGEAIAFRGSSVSDYVDSEGRRGSFQQRHNVYGREGLPCPVCGTPVRKIVLAGRGTHYCPVCQK